MFLSLSTIGLANFPSIRLIGRTFEHVLNANSIIVIDLIFIPTVLIVQMILQYSLYHMACFRCNISMERLLMLVMYQIVCGDMLGEFCKVRNSITKYFNRQFSIRDSSIEHYMFNDCCSRRCVCISYSKAPLFLQDNGLYISNSQYYSDSEIA